MKTEFNANIDTIKPIDARALVFFQQTAKEQLESRCYLARRALDGPRISAKRRMTMADISLQTTAKAARSGNASYDTARWSCDSDERHLTASISIVISGRVGDADWRRRSCRVP